MNPHGSAGAPSRGPAQRSGAFPSRHSPVWYALALALLTALTWWRTLGTEFIGDDTARITGMVRYLEQGYRASITTILPERPLLVMTVILNHALGGLDPRGYKALSLLFHLLAGLAFFLLLLSLQKRLCDDPHPLLPAVVAGLFLAHPLNSQALLSSIQRGVLMAALGALVSLLFFIDFLASGKRSRLLLSLLGYLLGILSKSFVAVLPLILLLYLAVIVRKIRPHLGVLLPYFAISLLPALLYGLSEADMLRQDSVDLLRWHEYLLVQTRVVWRYLGLFLFPANLRFFYEIDPDTALFRNFTWLAIVGHALILAAGFALLTRRRLAAFGIFAMYLAFLPESSVFPINHLAFEHRTYFPLLFFLLTLFALLPTRAGARKTCAVCALPVIAAFSLITNLRIEQVSTLERWAFDTHRHLRPTRENNLRLLADLYAAGSPPSAAAAAQAMEEKDSGFLPYALYGRLFSFAGASPQRQRETLDVIAQALLNRRQWLLDDAASINCFLNFFANNSERFADDPLVYRRNLELLFRAQLLYFFALPDLFSGNRLRHRQVLQQLRAHFEERLRTSGLAESDFFQYLNVLGQQGLYEPRSRDALAKLEERLKREFPERALLVDGSRDYYRRLQDQLDGPGTKPGPGPGADREP